MREPRREPRRVAPGVPVRVTLLPLLVQAGHACTAPGASAPHFVASGAWWPEFLEVPAERKLRGALDGQARGA